MRIGSPVRALTLANTFSPSVSPGPRYDVIDVRLALSNDALKTTGVPSRRATSAMNTAVSMACDSLSMTHGPRMKASGCPVPNVTEPALTGATACT